MTTLLDVLEEHFKDVKFDKAFSDRVYKYQVAFLNRDAEHLAFFGSNLIGVHAIRFRVADTLKFYQDVCDIDYYGLEKALRTVTTIVQEYKISSDPLNLTIMYCIHKVLNSPKLSQTQRERAAYDLGLVFFYRCIAIRQSDYFHFPADPKVAQAAFAELSKKILIKNLGTWRAVMEYRAKDLIDKKGLHYQNLVAFTDDSTIAYAISDSENRIRDLYKNYYKVFHKVNSEGNSIQVVSSTIIDGEGNEKLREKIKSTEQHISMLRQTILDKESFVRPELIKAIAEINSNSSYRMINFTIVWLCESYADPKWCKEIDEWLQLVVVHSFHLLNEASIKDTRDLPSVILTLKNLYLSTRSTDRDLESIRKTGDKFIKAANGKVNPSLSKATRTAIILYVALRSLVTIAR